MRPQPTPPHVLATLALATLALAAPGCRPPPSSSPPRAPAPNAEPDEPEHREAPADCGPRGERFVNLGWVPDDARVLAAVELSSPELKAATATLRAGTRDPAHKLPIRAAFSLGQWTWQLPLLRRTLGDAGFYPDDLVFVSLPDGTSVWGWPSSCDLETATARVADAWRIDLRPTPYGALAKAPTDDTGTPLFAYDLLVWGASFFALVPAGRGPAVAQHLGAPHLSQATTLPQVLGSIDTAPLRLATRTDDLMAPGGDTAQDSMLGHRIVEDAWTVLAPPTASSAPSTTPESK